jgi:hypothetical protein
MISKSQLETYYLKEGLSMQEIASLLECSVNKVVYWMDKHQIKRRSISDAVYQKHNPGGDPFEIQPIRNVTDAKLLGIGIGLYWGEGNKANQYSIRLGNTDPELIKTFIRFLVELFGVDKNKLRFGLQLFSDTKPEEALEFWVKQLGVKTSQFYKITVTISGSIGTYRHKSKNGVLTVYYHNKKLRDIIVGILPR